MHEAKLAEAVEKNYGLRASLRRLAGESENYELALTDGTRHFLKRHVLERHVLKLAFEDAGATRIQLEHQAVEALHAAGLKIGGVPIELPRLIPDLDGDVVTTLEIDGVSRLARLLSWVGGEPWTDHSPAKEAMLEALGELIGRLALVLGPLELPAARFSHRWDLASAGQHRQSIGRVESLNRRRLVSVQLERWAAIAPDLARVPRGLIHGDLNDENLLVTDGRLSGVLDFGDALHNPLICELAIALAYTLLDEEQPWRAGARVVAAYHAVRPLGATEIELLYPLICGRLAVSVIVAAERRRLAPERTAWFVTEKRAWAFLERHGQEDPVAIADLLASQIDVEPYPDRGVAHGELLKRRRAVTSGAQSISYSEPVKFIRGRGAYLVDERGRPFLDLYNNVCHVGHCHPRVVEAGQRQMAQLNTNTRYLTDAHVAYVERLAALLPESLDTVFMVNSGSEANELALRLAHTHSGHEDVMVVANAYHGHTKKLIEISPYKFMGRGGSGRAEPWVHVVPVPDGFRGAFKGQTRDVGRAYGDGVAEIIARSERPIGAFMAETLLSCGGQVIPPSGYFDTVFRHVRAAGGVCILDEVQVGFGRVGSSFWAFEHYDVVPDIVVLGKPIGNGHPMAAVICTQEIAESFENSGMEYFATFGGNPVSCAIGAAVLDVIEEEGLQEHARTTGAYFLEALREIEQAHACVGHVRGLGLFLGVDLVEDDGITPATALASRVVDALRGRRILTGTDGPADNVLKLKGPMVIDTADVDRFVMDLDRILTDVCSTQS